MTVATGNTHLIRFTAQVPPSPQKLFRTWLVLRSGRSAQLTTMSKSLIRRPSSTKEISTSTSRAPRTTFASIELQQLGIWSGKRQPKTVGTSWSRFCLKASRAESSSLSSPTTSTKKLLRFIRSRAGPNSIFQLRMTFWSQLTQ